jgi:hypothetical protein
VDIVIQFTLWDVCRTVDRDEQKLQVTQAKLSKIYCYATAKKMLSVSGLVNKQTRKLTSTTNHIIEATRAYKKTKET